jgi:MFS transporter, DHA1 family, inner membrane transport protein
MARTTTTSTDGGLGAVSGTLFLCMFAAQAGAIALSPVLAQVAHDLGVSIAWAGQLRTVAGLVAGVTALALARIGDRFGLGRQLLGGAALLALGSLGSAAAPDLAWLAFAQVPVGAGIAILTTAASLAAAAWVPGERRTTALSWALAGSPGAWIVGMPLIGLVAGRNWRYAWMVLPLGAALLAAAAVARRGRERPAGATRPSSPRAVLSAPDLRRWLAAELLVNTAWAGVLVYVGALFADSYDASPELVGAVLAVGAAAHVAGNLALRRAVRREPGDLLGTLGILLASTTALLGMLRPSLVVSAALFSAAAFAAGGRTLVSSSVGLAAPAELRSGAMAMRAASMQFGYFIGAFTAGTALALGGYAALGAALGTLFLVARAVLAWPTTRGVSAARPARGHRRHVAVAGSLGQAAGFAGGAAPEREPHRRP